MVFSLLNGLGAMGASISQFAGEYGLQAQRAELVRQQAMLADQLATARERDVTQPFLKGQQAERLTSEEARSAANNQTSLAVADKSAASALATAGIAAGSSRYASDAATARTQMEINRPTETQKLFEFLQINPDGTPRSGGTAVPQAAASPGAADGSAGARSIGADLVDKALGRPSLGSMERVRYATAQDVNSDPAFRDKSEGQRAAETERRVNEAYGGLSTDTKEQIAERLIAGDQGALTGLGYGNAGAANRAAVQEIVTQKLRAQGKTGADLAAQTSAYMGERAGARTAGTREANVGMAVNEAQLFMPLALEASKKVSRTSFPTLNSILLAAEKGTGGEDVVRLAVATNSLVNAYSRAITPSGIPTEGNQARARELLDKAWSAGQYEAAVDQLSKEMGAAKQSPIQQQQEQLNRISGRSAPSAASAPAATSPKPPAVGEVQQGYTFMGGDPANPNSWKRAQ